MEGRIQGPSMIVSPQLMAPNAQPARNQIKPGADEGYAGQVGVLIFALDCSGTVFLEAGTRFYSNDNKAPTPLRQR